MRFFQEKLIKATAEVLTKRVKLKQKLTVEQIKELTRNQFMASATYQELVSGELKNHFGFEKGTEKERVDAIVDVVVDGIYHKFDGWKPKKTHMEGNWRLHVHKSIYQGVLDLTGSFVINTGRMGGVIPWLDWLLTAGDDPVVLDFHIKLGSYEDKTYSRSGGAIMVPKFNWSVPQDYSGVEGDNWLTRTLTEPKFQQKIHKLITKMFA